MTRVPPRDEATKVVQPSRVPEARTPGQAATGPRLQHGKEVVSPAAAPSPGLAATRPESPQLPQLRPLDTEVSQRLSDAELARIPVHPSFAVKRADRVPSLDATIVEFVHQ